MFPLPHHQIPGGQARVEGSFHDGKGTTSSFFFFVIYLATPVLCCSMWDLFPRPGIEPRASCIGDAES